MSVAISDPALLPPLVRDQIDSWQSGSQPDAAMFLAQHPELASDKTLVLKLAREEYYARARAGETLSKREFCDRFPAFQQSIEAMFEIEQYLDQCPQFALPRQQLPWPKCGDRFLGYEVVELLGSGALARVYFAREPALGNRPVVIKVSRFGSYEAETLGKLSHPNIVPIHSVQHDSVTGGTAICMPLLGTATAIDLLKAAFAEGKPRDGAVIARVAATARPIVGLSTAVNVHEAQQWRGPYADAIARLGLQLASGLQAAHAAGVRHHDIKPSNVLLAWSGRPMLLDFNLSTDEDASIDQAGGTWEYIAPELIANWNDTEMRAALRQDSRCDIYSLGAVLYQLLTNKLPAGDAGAGPPDLKHKQQPPAALGAIDAEIDPRLEAIVLKCLALDPAGRYATAGELAAELQEYVSLPQAAWRFVGRNRRGFLAAGAALAVAAVSGAAYVRSRPPYSERLLARGLSEFERGDYPAALTIFDQCVDLNRDWPEARFARGQTLRALGRWIDARDDFAELKSVHQGWSHALMGFCYMRAKKEVDAASEYRYAHQEGIRNLQFLLNYADALRRRNFFSDAVKIYTEALAVAPDSAAGRRGRANAYYGVAIAQANQKMVPDAQAFADAREDIRLSPGSYEAPFLAAGIFGYAVMMDSDLHCLREEGAEHFKHALRMGLPYESYEGARARLDLLMNDEIQSLLERAPPRNNSIYHERYPQQEFPLLAKWDAFLKAVRELQP